MKNNTTGYKIMELRGNKLISLASDCYQFELKIGDKIKMDGEGVWLSTNRDFVVDYYGDNEDIINALLTVEFDKAKITRGNLNDSEPVITVPEIIVKNIQIVEDGKIKDLPKSIKKQFIKKTIKNNNF